MKASLILFLIGVGAILAHVHVRANHTAEENTSALITRESVAKLKEVAPFEVMDYEKNPFRNMTKQQIIKKLGLMPDIPKSVKPFFYGKVNTSIADAFDSRDQWPNCIHAIRDQQSCGSCWAFAASEVTSDRYCIATNGKVDTIFSPQDLVSCDTATGDMGCNGGYVPNSWDYIKDTGLASDDCMPYTSGDGDSGTCASTCADGSEITRTQVKSHNQHTSIEEAQNDIAANGPIEAAFYVYADFMNYAGGIYVQTSDQLMGGHAVKIVGWGTDAKVGQYWIVANSWNTSWGLEGFFYIKFGECNFESQLWSGVPITSNQFLKHSHH